MSASSHRRKIGHGAIISVMLFATGATYANDTSPKTMPDGSKILINNNGVITATAAPVVVDGGPLTFDQILHAAELVTAIRNDDVMIKSLKASGKDRVVVASTTGGITTAPGIADDWHYISLPTSIVISSLMNDSVEKRKELEDLGVKSTDATK